MGQNLGPLNIKDTYQSLVQISGSVLTDGSGSAIPSVTVNASTATSASFATTATTSTSASYASTATSASYATTASFALNVTPIDTGSFVTTASISDADITFTKADASTFNIEVNNVSSSISASHADNASTADSATTATSASFATTASFAGNAGSSFLATSASHALVADTATSASYATNASTADSATSASHAVNADSATTATTATSASYATTASHALGLVDGLNINATSITASGANFTNLTATSASIGFLQTVTGSATIIGDAFILLNTSDATRYAGLLVEDSGSATPVNYTASWFFDSLTNDWNYEYTSGSTDYGVALFGPTYSTKGTPTYLTANTIPKGQGNHHLVDSNISDDGSTITLSADTTLYKSGTPAVLIVTSDDDYTYASTLTLGGQPGGAGDQVTISNFAGIGYMFAQNGFSFNSNIVSSANITAAAFTGSSFTGSFTGSLQGNADTATSASYATTASFALNAGGDPAGLISGSGAGSLKSANYQTTASKAEGANTIAIGNNTIITGSNTTAAIAIGSNILIQDNAYETILIGNNFNAQNSKLRTVQIGHNSGTNFANQNSVGLGYNHNVSDSTVSIGYGASGGNNAVAIGRDSGAATNGIAIGYNISAGATNEINIGDRFKFNGTDTITLSGSVVGEVGALTIASTTASMDCSAGNFFTLTLVSGSDTHLDATNLQTGQTINVKVLQPGTGYGTISFSSDFAFPSGSSYTGSAASNAVDIVSMVSFDTSKLYANKVENLV